jgi:hypothetical protein
LWEGDNLFVNSGLPALANLIAGATAGQYATAIGFGSGAAAPNPTDVGLSASPSYYNAIGTHSFLSSGSVQFNYSLQATDYAANGITIEELGLFANAAPISLPSAVATTNPSWTATTTQTVGSLVVDSNGNVQRCAVGGTTGATTPAWSVILNGNTTDGSVTWTLVAFHGTPGPMLAHVIVPAFPYAGAANYSGTWTLTF